MSDWHTSSVEQTLQTLGTDLTQGLAQDQARTRLREQGPNELVEGAARSPWRMLLAQFTETMVIILIAAAVASGLLGKTTETVAILAIVLMFAILGFIQEYRAERAMAALKKLAVPTVRLRRGGQVRELPARDVVPGDVVLLEAGNVVPADLRFIEAVNLRVQEAALTGESQPVEKQADALDDPEEGCFPTIGDPTEGALEAERHLLVRRALVALALGLGVTASLLALLSLGLPVRAAPAAEHLVCPDGCAYSSIQDAVDAAGEGDVIKVAQGAYAGVHQRGGVTQVVYIDESVAVRGGYTTANGFADPPDPMAYPTTLNAGREGRVVYVASGVSVTLEGLRLVGGDGSGLGGGTGAYPDAGGGFYVDQWAAATFSDCVVVDNRSPMAGGGYTSRHVTFTLQNSLITANVAISGNAGGIQLYAPSQALLTGNTIVSNSAGFNGGGIYVAHGYSDTLISRNSIVSNAAAKDGGGMFMASGAVVRENVLAHNTAAASGGGLYINSRSPLVVSNRVFDNRATNYGGGVYVSGEALLQANTVISNTGHRGGGGLLLYRSLSRLENNVVAGNRIDSGRNGAGLYVWNGDPRLLHTTVAENVGGDGSGVYARDLTGPDATAFLTNTVLVSQTVGVAVTDGSTLVLECTLWGSGPWANEVNTAGSVLSSTNVSGDPGFVAPARGDYHVGSNSAVIDAGVDAGVAVDIDGDTRPAGAGYDIGADELWWRVFLPVVLRLWP